MKVVKNTSQSREKNVIGLSHKNIVKVLNVIDNEINEYSIIFMEYYANSFQLQHIVEDSKTDIGNKLVKFSIDISEGLEYCHRNNILHLDIKPQNILVCGNVCKICDFGNSLSVNDEKTEFKVNTLLKNALRCIMCCILS